MDIELRKISFNERMSEETNCFVADIWIDGKKAGYAKNQGHGGPTDYHWYDEEGRRLIKEAEQYCLTLPPVISDGFTLEMNLEFHVDLLLEKYLNEKSEQKGQKKLQKDMLTGICYGIPTSYRKFYWKQNGKPVLISDMKKYPVTSIMVDNMVKKLKMEGHTILNTNL